jgi:hypothetical protein
MFIIPSKWMVGGRNLKSFRQMMKNNQNLRYFYDFEDASDVFPGIHIDAGICYFLWDREFEGSCDYVFHHRNGEVIKSKRELDNTISEYIIRDPRVSPIAEKTSKAKIFSEIVSSVRPYGIRKYLFNDPSRYPDFGLSDQPFTNSVKIYGVKGIKGGAKRKVGYIRKDVVKDNSISIDKFKLFFTTSYSTNAVIPPEIIVGEPGEVCTETFLLIGPFDTRAEMLNCKKYMESQFFRVLLLFGKGTMQVQKSVFRYIPLVDFSSELSDKDLFKLCGLTQEEIDFIHNTFNFGLSGAKSSETQKGDYIEL